MTRSDFFKSVAGTLAIFGLAKAVKPEVTKIPFEICPYVPSSEIRLFGFTIQISKSTGAKMARYAREAEIWSDWMPYDQAEHEVYCHYYETVLKDQSAKRYNRTMSYEMPINENMDSFLQTLQNVRRREVRKNML